MDDKPFDTLPDAAQDAFRDAQPDPEPPPLAVLESPLSFPATLYLAVPTTLPPCPHRRPLWSRW